MSQTAAIFVLLPLAYSLIMLLADLQNETSERRYFKLGLLFLVGDGIAYFIFTTYENANKGLEEAVGLLAFVMVLVLQIIILRLYFKKVAENTEADTVNLVFHRTFYFLSIGQMVLMSMEL